MGAGAEVARWGMGSGSGGLMAVGEWISTMAKHEGSAAAGTWVVGVVVLRICNSGLMESRELAVCSVLLAAGRALAWRSVAKQRAAFV